MRRYSGRDEGGIGQFSQKLLNTEVSIIMRERPGPQRHIRLVPEIGEAPLHEDTLQYGATVGISGPTARRGAYRKPP